MNSIYNMNYVIEGLTTRLDELRIKDDELNQWVIKLCDIDTAPETLRTINDIAEDLFKQVSNLEIEEDPSDIFEGLNGIDELSQPLGYVTAEEISNYYHNYISAKDIEKKSFSYAKFGDDNIRYYNFRNTHKVLEIIEGDVVDFRTAIRIFQEILYAHPNR